VVTLNRFSTHCKISVHGVRKTLWKDVGEDGRIVLKRTLKRRCELGSSGFGSGTVARSCEGDNKHPGCLKRYIFLDKPSKYHLQDKSVK